MYAGMQAIACRCRLMHSSNMIISDQHQHRHRQHSTNCIGRNHTVHDEYFDFIISFPLQNENKNPRNERITETEYSQLRMMVLWRACTRSILSSPSSSTICVFSILKILPKFNEPNNTLTANTLIHWHSALLLLLLLPLPLLMNNTAPHTERYLNCMNAECS